MYKDNKLVTINHKHKKWGFAPTQMQPKFPLTTKWYVIKIIIIKEKQGYAKTENQI